MACDHSNKHRSDVQIVSLIDDDGVTTARWVAEVRVWCDECGTPFVFTGPGFSRSQDQREVRLPMLPVPVPAPSEMH